MIGQLAHLNWIGVGLAFLAYFLLGALWFTLFFTKAYKIALGRGDEALKNTAPIFIVGPALCSLVITITTSVLLSALQVRHWGEAVELSLLVGIGYLVANTINIAINPNIPRPILYGVITGAYHLLGIVIVGLILIAMK